jgi:hypothetical protein
MLFPSVGLAPPYHLVENVTGVAHWLVPAGLLASDILVHALAACPSAPHGSPGSWAKRSFATSCSAFRGSSP